MHTLGIIGTAGRGSDAGKLNYDVWSRMLVAAQMLMVKTGATHLVSGGAAWADHLAVALVLDGSGRMPVTSLTLHLPTEFKDGRYVEKGDPRWDPGKTANFYHRQFSNVTGFDSLHQINQVIQIGATTTVSAGGFKARNLKVAQDSQSLLAFTFGHQESWQLRGYTGETSAADAGLKDGGTAHTWDHCSGIKYHACLA